MQKYTIRKYMQIKTDNKDKHKVKKSIRDKRKLVKKESAREKEDREFG